MTSEKQVTIPEGYKQTEVGVIPEEWNVISIDHALNTKMILDQMDGNHGELYPKSHDFSDFGIPYVGATDFNNGRVNFTSCKYLPLNRARLFKKGIAKHGDVLFAHNATVGPVALLETEFEFVILSTTATYYRPDISQINNKYLASYFESQLFANQYSSVMSQSTRNQVPILTQRKFKLVLPNIQEQTAIANALSDVDNLIAALETLIAKKSAIKTAAMQQLLTGKKRLPGFLVESAKESVKARVKESEKQAATQIQAQAAKHNSDQPANSAAMANASQIKTAQRQHVAIQSHSNQSHSNQSSAQTAPRPGYKQTELGEVPVDWEVRDVSETCDLLTGYPFPSTNYSVHGIRLLRGSNVKRGNTDWTEGITQYWPAITADIKQYELCEGDIVISMDGSLVGRSFAQLSQSDLPALLLQRVARLRSTTVSVSFLKEWVCSKFFTEHCDSVKTVTAIPHISPEDIRTFKFLCPPTVKEQTAIANVLSDMDAELDALQQRLSKTKTIKQGMMQELLTGKTRLV